MYCFQVDDPARGKSTNVLHELTRLYDCRDVCGSVCCFCLLDTLSSECRRDLYCFVVCERNVYHI